MFALGMIQFKYPIVFGETVIYGSGFNCSVTAIDTDKVLIAYTEGPAGYQGKAIVGTISGTTITFGSEATFETDPVGNCSVTAIDTDKVLIAYSGPFGYQEGKAIVGTISGTTITFGSEATFETIAGNIDVAKIETDKAVIAYYDGNDSGKGKSLIATISGTTITFNTLYTFETGAVGFFAVILISTDKILIAFGDVGDSGKGKAIVGTISGTTITFGSAVTFANTGVSGAYYISADAIDSDKTLISFCDPSDSGSSKAIVGTISGTTITFGTAVNFFNGTAGKNKSVKMDTDKILIAFDSFGKGQSVVGTISGTTPTFETEVIFNNASTNYLSATFISSNKAAIVSEDGAVVGTI